MGKSSSLSKKKKRSKDSSRKKKRRGIKSKKILRRDDHSDDSESSSWESSSCSSSEDDYWRHKRRSKGSKKRSRRRDSSSESEDDTHRLKKKKKKLSKRNDKYARKKKTRPRKKRGRDVSVSSASSKSCSTFYSESNSGFSGESEGGRKRGRLEGRGEDRGLDKVKAKRRRSNDEARSCSSCSQDVEPDDYQLTRDEVLSEKISRRLRSVIVVPTTPNDDEGKDEMGYGREDYFKCRGNDSIDEAEKGELEHYEVSQENKTMDDGKDGEAMISGPRTGADVGGSKKNACYVEFGDDFEMETTQATDPDDVLKGDDLETILRMRALENLRRFRGGTHGNGVASQETTRAADGESLPTESAKVEESPGHGLVEQKLSISARSRDFESSHKTSQDTEYEKESGSVSHDLTYAQDQSGDTAKGKVSGGVSSCTTRPKLTRLVQRREIANFCSGEQAAGMQDSQAELSSEGTIDKDCPESSQNLGAYKRSENFEPKGNGTPNEQSSVCAETEVGDRGSDKPHGEAREGFEEKTMSVMQGGEMVQVSYKVYIPKKTPALARRKIKR